VSIIEYCYSIHLWENGFEISTEGKSLTEKMYTRYTAQAQVNVPAQFYVHNEMQCFWLL